MTKTLEKREKQRDDLVAAAERRITAEGLTGLKSRDLARDIGCSNGAVFNLVEDMDELVLRVGSRTLARLDGALTSAASEGAPPGAALVAIALSYCDFAAKNLELWRPLLEHGMAQNKPIPDWAVSEQM